MVKQRNSMQPFDVREGRAMVSLGPLNKEHFCVYKCPFCYVNGDFPSYASLDTPDILKWLREHYGTYDIIYVSGDTDSFAPPRTLRALDLLERLSEFQVDLMFTTRSLLPLGTHSRLAAVAETLRMDGHSLFGCTSISQFSKPELEPPPIPSTHDRVQQVQSFRDLGLISVLAMRPFLPVVPPDDYLAIVTACAASAHIVLGKEWFSDSEGRMDAAVFCGDGPVDYHHTLQRMDWDDNKTLWKVYSPRAVEMAVSSHCEKLGKPFFMKSRLAVEWARRHRDLLLPMPRSAAEPAVTPGSLLMNAASEGACPPRTPQYPPIVVRGAPSVASNCTTGSYQRTASPQVVGVGALNVNYVVPFTKAQAYLKQITRGRIEAGQETWVADNDIDNTLHDLGYQNVDYCGLGGAAYHTVDCLAQIGVGLSLGYIGAAGMPVPDAKGGKLDILEKLKIRSIDHHYVHLSSNGPGRTVSIRNTKDKSRSNQTAPGANDELLSFIDGKEDALSGYLAGAQWVHLSSLVDRKCMLKVVELVQRAKRINDRLIVSFDPGSEYCRLPEQGGMNIVERVLACVDYLFVNSAEFDQLAAIRDRVPKQRRDTTDTAATVFEAYQCDGVSIIVQNTNYYRVQFFWKVGREVLSRREFKYPLWHSGVKEVTGASGILAAGIIAAHLLPDIGYDSRLSARFAMALVRQKLGRTGFEAGGEYQRMLIETRANLRRKDSAKPLFEYAVQWFGADVLIKGVLGSLLAALIVYVISILSCNSRPEQQIVAGDKAQQAGSAGSQQVLTNSAQSGEAKGELPVRELHTATP